MYGQEKVDTRQAGIAYSQPQMANTLRPSTEVEQHLHRCNERLEELNAKINNLRDVLGNVLAENGPECPPNMKEPPPIQVTCALSDRISIISRQIDSMAYEIQNITNRVRA
jgi:hypothetical protein